MRLQGKIAVVIGAGQSPGEGIGNGRATVLRFAREGDLPGEGGFRSPNVTSLAS